jgi:hypothetical protein
MVVRHFYHITPTNIFFRLACLPQTLNNKPDNYDDRAVVTTGWGSEELRGHFHKSKLFAIFYVLGVNHSDAD